MATSQPTEPSALLTHAEAHLKHLLTHSPVYSHFLASARVVHAAPSHAIIYLPLQPHHLNSKGTLHGAVTATLVDFAGGLAVAVHDTRDDTGVSTDIHVSYVGAARQGDTVEVDGRADKVGGSLAYTRVTVRKVEEGKGLGEGTLVATGSHTKFVRQR